MSDTRSPNWVDYGNLGANLAEVGLLVSANRKVSQLVRVQQEQAARLRQEEELRQFIFELEEGLDRLGPFQNSAPLGVATVAGYFDGWLEKVGVQTSTFQQFVDKDRVKALRLRLFALEEQGLNNQPQAKRDEVKRAISLSSHLEDLKELIAALEAKEELNKSEEEWKEVQELKNEAGGRWAALTWVCVGIGILCLCLGGYDQGPSHAYMFPCALGMLAGLGALVGFIKKSNSTPKEYKELKQKRSLWQSKLMPHPKYQSICQVFGEGLPIDEYKRAAGEIEQFMRKVLEFDKDGNSLPVSLLRLALPPQVVDEKK